MEWLVKRLLMILARFGEVSHIEALQFWAYDTILAHGWDGVDTFIRLELFDAE